MKKIQNLLLITSVTILYFSCNKQYDDPPVNQVPIGNIISINHHDKDMFTGSLTVIDSNYIFLVMSLRKKPMGIFTRSFYANLNLYSNL